MQKKLAKAIKNNNNTPKARLQKIDRQYSFNKFLGNNHNEAVNIKEFNNLSNIYTPDSENIKPFKIFDASTKLDFKTMFLKKNTHK